MIPIRQELKCEACSHMAQNILINDAVYYLCSNCLFEIITHNLSPEGFKSLLKAGHTAEEFLLHSDFFDEEGNALQPSMEMWELMRGMKK